jgi:hypothetical protein
MFLTIAGASFALMLEMIRSDEQLDRMAQSVESGVCKAKTLISGLEYRMGDAALTIGEGFLVWGNKTKAEGIREELLTLRFRISRLKRVETMELLTCMMMTLTSIVSILVIEQAGVEPGPILTIVLLVFSALVVIKIGDFLERRSIGQRVSHASKSLNSKEERQLPPYIR